MAPKRAAGPAPKGGGASAEKKQRQNQNEDHGGGDVNTQNDTNQEEDVDLVDDEVDLTQSRDFQYNPTMGLEAEVGIIEQVSVKNFMCHTRLEFNFCPQVNFIIGRNGSGKSAVLTALVVGLGGKANVTNRGTSVKGFIKTGKPWAEVIVKLRNQGQDAYKPDLFGKSIIVERRLTREGGTSYKLKSFDGKLVSTKREELNHILDTFNIQVDNPVAVLNQDCSRNFLQSKNAQDKYKFFLKATQLEQLKHDYVVATEAKEFAIEVLRQKQETMPALQDEVTQLEEQYKASRAITGLNDRVKQLKDEQAWAIIVKAEKDLEQGAKELRTEESRTPKFLGYIKKHENELSDLNKRRTNLHSQIQESQKEALELEPRYKESKTKLNETKLAFRNSQMEVRKVTCDWRNFANEHKAILDRIQEIKNSAQQDYEFERMQREEKVKELQERIASLQTAQQSAEHELEQYKATINKHKEDQHSLRADEQELAQKQERYQQELHTQERARKDRMNRFGAWMPNVLARIEADYKKGLFHKKPCGPLGSYLELKDQKWAVAIEACLKSLIHAFTVHDHHDERQLESIFAAVCPEGRKPATITAPFQDRIYDVSQYRSQSKEYPAVLDVLRIKNPVVANCLIDQRTIENVLLIESNEEARQVMMRNPPRNVREAFTFVGDQVYCAPIFRYYSNGAKQANILTASVETNIKYCQDKIRQLDTDRHQMVARQRELRSEVQKNEQQATSCKARLNRLRDQISKVTLDLTELREREDPAPVDITTLEEEAKQIKDTLKHLEEKKVAAESLVSEFKADVKLKDEEFKEMGDRLSQLAEGTEPFKEQRAQLDDRIVEVEGYMTHYVQKKRDHDRKIADLKSKHERQKNKLEEDTVKANRFCPRIETRRSADNIECEIRQIQKQITKQEKTRGNHEEVTRKYHELKESYRKIMTEVTQLNNYLKALDVVMVHRQQQYFEFRKMIAVRVKYFFILMLSNRNYTGKLSFNHQKELLNMTVTPNANAGEISKDMKSLSGGERSFATVCFILSLWDAMESPFRCLDEFDIFMDLVNRRIATEMMLNVASQQKGRQFIFLTPLELTQMKIGNNIRVYRMPDPDRGQGTLPFAPIEGANANAEQAEEEEENNE